MPLVLELDALDLARPRRFLGRNPLQRLHAGFLIGGDHVDALLFESLRHCVRVAHAAHLIGVSLGVRLLGLGVQPVPGLVGAQVDLLLKNDPLAVERYCR